MGIHSDSLFKRTNRSEGSSGQSGTGFSDVVSTSNCVLGMKYSNVVR
jgi:hypothetical protein